jgi:hypothetical protein
MITARKQTLDGKMANNLNVKSGSSLARESEERQEREREREREREKVRGMGTSGVHCGS